MGSSSITVRPLPHTTPSQVRDTRAHAWAFVFQCWQEKQKAAGRLPSPDGQDDTEGSTNDRTANDEYTS